MARWKPPDDRNPGRDGFTRIPEPAGGGGKIAGRSPTYVEPKLRQFHKDMKSDVKKYAEKTKHARKARETISSWNYAKYGKNPLAHRIYNSKNLAKKSANTNYKTGGKF